jgi:hypothetical protein
MAKADLKTKETEVNFKDFLNTIDDETVRKDCRVIAEMMSKATKSEAKMWGANIVGFGSQLLKYESGRELDWMKIGFSPRKANITLYLHLGTGLNEDNLSRLGKHKTGKGCLYIKKLDDVDLEILEKLIANAVK